MKKMLRNKKDILLLRKKKYKEKEQCRGKKNEITRNENT